MGHPRGAYVLNALMVVSSHTRCREFADFIVGSVVLRFFCVQLPWLIIPFPYFVRATSRACDCFPELAYESENSSQGKGPPECYSLHKYSMGKQDHHPQGAIGRDA